MEVGTQTWRGSVGNVFILFFVLERTWEPKPKYVILLTLLFDICTLIVTTENKIGSLFLSVFLMKRKRSQSTLVYNTPTSV